MISRTFTEKNILGVCFVIKLALQTLPVKIWLAGKYFLNQMILIKDVPEFLNNVLWYIICNSSNGGEIFFYQIILIKDVPEFLNNVVWF